MTIIRRVEREASFPCAQGLPVIKALLEKAEDGTPSPYAIHALTRNPKNPRAKEVEQQGVELIKGYSKPPSCII
ncbi:hypothetical protein BS47DRAFT_1356090 [Hydnum rufescens UP504]|uniref:Uncharacterized protein n=1 Tax=Hydnum rufescens UP504 TaxID=1448309 RepID=A0A9P6ACU9_9AGAM|nr:hypothetical protein BS47DRAFT_1356090 [Hydnum rufescens UP504]